MLISRNRQNKRFAFVLCMLFTSQLLTGTGDSHLAAPAFQRHSAATRQQMHQFQHDFSKYARARTGWEVRGEPEGRNRRTRIWEKLLHPYGGLCSPGPC